MRRQRYVYVRLGHGFGYLGCDSPLQSGMLQNPNPGFLIPTKLIRKHSNNRDRITLQDLSTNKGEKNIDVVPVQPTLQHIRSFLKFRKTENHINNVVYQNLKTKNDQMWKRNHLQSFFQNHRRIRSYVGEKSYQPRWVKETWREDVHVRQFGTLEGQSWFLKTATFWRIQMNTVTSIISPTLLRPRSKQIETIIRLHFRGSTKCKVFQKNTSCWFFRPSLPLQPNPLSLKDKPKIAEWRDLTYIYF